MLRDNFLFKNHIKYFSIWIISFELKKIFLQIQKDLINRLKVKLGQKYVSESFITDSHKDVSILHYYYATENQSSTFLQWELSKLNMHVGAVCGGWNWTQGLDYYSYILPPGNFFLRSILSHGEQNSFLAKTVLKSKLENAVTLFNYCWDETTYYYSPLFSVEKKRGRYIGPPESVLCSDTGIGLT